MSLIEQRTAIVAAVKAVCPELVDCQSHGGRFTLDDFKRIAQRTPTVRVGCLGIRDMVNDGAGGIDATATWGIFVITTDKPQLPRDGGALILVNAIATIIPDNLWNNTATGYPEGTRGDNLFSSQLEGIGVALWAITWQQKLTLGGLDPAGLDDFITFNAAYNLTGTADAQDTITLEQ